MGVWGVEYLSLTPDMNSRTSSTDSPVPAAGIFKKNTLKEGSQFGYLYNSDDTVCVTGSMKLKTDTEIEHVEQSQHILPSDISTELKKEMGCFVPVCVRSLGQEFSLSLPNLTSPLDKEMSILCQINDSETRNSLGNIKSITDETNLPFEKSFKETSEIEDQDLKKINMSRSNETTVPLKKVIDFKDSNPPIDLTIDVTTNNSKLSTVLENIPLVYLPHTKQLVSVGNNEKENILYKSEGLTYTFGYNNNVNESIDIKPALDEQDNVDCSSNRDSEYSCSSLALSQDSEVSCKSDLTIIEADNILPVTYSQGNPNINLQNGFEEKIENICELTSQTNLLEKDSPRNSLPRTNSTTGSLTRTDASSFSSISSISTGTDFSISATSYTDDYADNKGLLLDADEGNFSEASLQGKNTFERSRNSSLDSGIDENQPHHGAKPKRRGITGFFTRNLFWRKTKDPTSESSAPGWKLFGKIPPKEAPMKDPNQIYKDYEASRSKPSNTDQFCRLNRSNVEAPSTTALILEQRPHGLPSKDPDEELRHKLEYEAMVEMAKKKEMKEAKLKKKQLQRQLRHEEALSAALKVWNTEILSNWDTMRNVKKARDLWWTGIPPSVRGKVWKLAIGNDLNITPELYEICLNRAKDRLKLIQEALFGGSDTDSVSSFTLSESSVSKEASVELIKLDVSRTFPQLCIFQKGGPYHELLHSLLGAYVCYRPDVGYVQGMSFVAAVLLLNMEVEDAFICFTNLLNQPCQVAFFRLDESLIKSYFDTYEEFFEENLPNLYSHFKKLSLTPDLYIIDWMFTMYSKSLPLDVASRVWDVFCRDGEEFLFRTALGILTLYEDILIDMDFIHLAQFLTKLPENISGECLFKCLECVHMTIEKKNFQQVLASNRENKDTS